MLYLFNFTIDWLITFIITRILNRSLPERIIFFFSERLFRRRVKITTYEHWFKIKKWKDRLPQFSKYDSKTFDKSHLKSTESGYLDEYKRALEKGIFAHSFPPLIMFIAYIFVPSREVLISCLLISAVHLPFRMILRYNLFRIEKLMKMNCRRGGHDGLTPAVET